MTASLEIQHLAQQGVEDRDSMSDEAREALLDWVRDEQDKWRHDVGPAGMVALVYVELDLPLRLARELCDEAGLPVPPAVFGYDPETVRPAMPAARAMSETLRMPAHPVMDVGTIRARFPGLFYWGDERP
jgi:hypothetical protein